MAKVGGQLDRIYEKVVDNKRRPLHKLWSGAVSRKRIELLIACVFILLYALYYCHIVRQG